MTTYNTGNPLGSSDPRDLYDNAENLDNFVNGAQPAYDDRLGESRKSWVGIEQDFADFLASSGYKFLGDYAAGIEVTAYNQVIRDGGEFWRAAADTELPYTTTGAGMPEGGTFVAVGDAALRQELAASTTGQGSDLIAHTGTSDTVTEALDKRVIYVGSVAELEALDVSGFVEGQPVVTSDDKGFIYAWTASANISGGDVVAAQTGYFFRKARGRYSYLDIVRRLPKKMFSDTKAIDAISFTPESLYFVDNATQLQYIFVTCPVAQSKDVDFYLEVDSEVAGSSSSTLPYMNMQIADDLDRTGALTVPSTTTEYPGGWKTTVANAEITKNYVVARFIVPVGISVSAVVSGFSFKQSGKVLANSEVMRLIPSSSNWSGDSFSVKFEDGISPFAILTFLDRPLGASFTSPERVDISPNGSSEYIRPPYGLGFYAGTIQNNTSGLASNLNLSAGEYHPYRSTTVLNISKDTNLASTKGKAKLLAGRELATDNWTVSTVGSVTYITAPYDADAHYDASVRSGAAQPDLHAVQALNSTSSNFLYTFTNVTSASEVQAAPYRYWYDSASQTMHFSFDAAKTTSYVYVPEARWGVYATTQGASVFGANIDVIGAERDGWRIAPASYSQFLSGKGGPYFGAYNCSGNGCGLNGFSVDFLDGQMVDCVADSNYNDGFNFHDEGLTYIEGGRAWFNSADGMSHHENCVGYADKVSFRFNGAAGSVPAYGAKVWHEQCECVPATADSRRPNSYSGKFAILSNSAGDAWAVFNQCYSFDAPGTLYEAIAQDAGSVCNLTISSPNTNDADATIYTVSGAGTVNVETML